VVRSPAGSTSRSNIPADGSSTSVASKAASGQQKPSPSVARGSIGGGKARSPVDGGPRPQQPAVPTRPAERLPVYGSAVGDRRSVPPDGSGQAEERSGTGTSRPMMSSSAAASAAAQVTFQDPIESEYAAHYCDHYYNRWSLK